MSVEEKMARQIRENDRARRLELRQMRRQRRRADGSRRSGRASADGSAHQGDEGDLDGWETEAPPEKEEDEDDGGEGGGAAGLEEFDRDRHVFKKEADLYKAEEIDFPPFNFIDNQRVIDLLEKRPMGLFLLLDEEMYVIACLFTETKANY